MFPIWSILFETYKHCAVSCNLTSEATKGLWGHGVNVTCDYPPSCMQSFDTIFSQIQYTIKPRPPTPKKKKQQQKKQKNKQTTTTKPAVYNKQETKQKKLPNSSPNTRQLFIIFNFVKSQPDNKTTLRRTKLKTQTKVNTQLKNIIKINNSSSNLILNAKETSSHLSTITDNTLFKYLSSSHIRVSTL